MMVGSVGGAGSKEDNGGGSQNSGAWRALSIYLVQERTQTTKISCMKVLIFCLPMSIMLLPYIIEAMAMFAKHAKKPKLNKEILVVNSLTE